jgi:hypothetical protein
MRAQLLLIAIVAFLSGTGCGSHSDNVCEDIGNCAQRGDNTWIDTCQANADLLGAEAAAAGCQAAFDQYYGCADANYACQGATATFPGCDQALAALDGCIAAATSGTACVRLQMAQAACTTVPAASGPPPACTAIRDCQAACYLSTVANACAVQIDELQAVVTCSEACPP